MVDQIVKAVLDLTDGEIPANPDRPASKELLDLLGPDADLTPAQRQLIGRAVGVIEANRGKAVSLSDRADILQLGAAVLKEAADAR